MEAAVDSQITVDVSVKAQQSGLMIHYSVHNPNTQAIFIFDRLWDSRLRSLDSNWANIDVAGTQLVVRRALSRKPNGLQFETPPVPYGRRLDAGSACSGEFELVSPIQESGPYLDFVSTGPSNRVKVTGFVLEIGWCTEATILPRLTKGATVKVGDEELILPSYYLLAEIERVFRCPAIPLEHEVMTFPRRS